MRPPLRVLMRRPLRVLTQVRIRAVSHEPFSKELPAGPKGLINGLPAHDAKKRLTASGALKCGWLKQARKHGLKAMAEAAADARVPPAATRLPAGEDAASSSASSSVSSSPSPGDEPTGGGTLPTGPVPMAVPMAAALMRP